MILSWLLYDLVKVSLRNCTDHTMNCIGVVTHSNLMGTNIHLIVTNKLHRKKKTVAKSQSDNIVEVHLYVIT